MKKLLLILLVFTIVTIPILLLLIPPPALEINSISFDIPEYENPLIVTREETRTDTTNGVYPPQNIRVFTGKISSTNENKIIFNYYQKRAYQLLTASNGTITDTLYSNWISSTGSDIFELTGLSQQGLHFKVSHTTFLDLLTDNKSWRFYLFDIETNSVKNVK